MNLKLRQVFLIALSSCLLACEDGFKAIESTTRSSESENNVPPEEPPTDPNPPTVQIVSTPPSLSAQESVSFVFTGENALSFECHVNSSFSPCSSPVTYSLASGTYTFNVRSVGDQNSRSTIATFSFTIDRTAPTVTISSGPSGQTTDSSANFAFSALDSHSTVAQLQCRLNDQAFANCTSPRSYNNLSIGDHTFQVRAIDQVGNVSQVASRSWTIQEPAPVTRSIQLAWDANAESNLVGYRIYYGTSSGQYLQQRGQGIAVVSSSQPTATIENLQSGVQYFIAVTAYDSSGNESPYSLEISATTP